MATSATEGFTVDQPVVTAQHPRNGGQSLTIMVRVYPSPPPPPTGPTIPWWLARPNPGKSLTRSNLAQVALGDDDPPAPERRAIIVLVTVDPAPVLRVDAFKLAAMSATDGYSVDEPVVLGQFARNAGQALTIKLSVYPSPPPLPAVHPVPWRLVSPDPAKFGRLVRLARQRAGMTQAEFARQTGVSEMTIRNVESGALTCSPKTRSAVLDALARAGQELSSADPEPQQKETEDKK